MGSRGAITAALLAALTLAAPAQAANRTFEAEQISFSGAAAVVEDGAASGGRALELAPGAHASGAVATAAPAYWMAIRAVGRDCLGPPQIAVRMDGMPVYSGAVPTMGYGDVELRLPALARGTHAMDVEVLDQGGFLPGCTRSARIDRVTVYAPFADKSFRNRPLADDARLAPDSKRLVRSIKRQARITPGRVWVNTNNWSVPVYIVPAGQPPARVTSPYPEVQAQLDGAPLPPNARPADPPTGDAELVLYQPATNRIWDFHHLQKVGGKWTAQWGGRIDDASESPGYFTNARNGLTFGASASRLALLGGLQQIEELRSGTIDHAVDLVLPNVTQGKFVWPAQASDHRGRAIGKDPVPEGTRFRLPASLDIDALNLPPYTRTLARAIQRYGAVVRDRGGVVSFKAEDHMPWGYDPYKEIFGGLWPDEGGLFAQFPWGRLQVVAPPKKKR